MAKTTTTKPDIRFIVDVKPSKISDSLDLDFIVVVIQDGKIRNPGSYDEGVSQYVDLHFSTHCDREDKDFYVRYAAEGVTYKEVFSVDLRRAEVMVKTLRRIDKGLRALADKWGSPQDFAAFMAHVTQVIGCTDRFPFARLTSKSTGWSYDDNEYTWMDVDGLRYHLHSKIQEWRGENA